MIYFAQPVEGGPVKIGCTRDVESRLMTLEAHYGKSLALLATMEGDRDTEREIHTRFVHLRMKGSGPRGRWPEQFRPASDLMAFIDRPLLTSPNPEAAEVMNPVRSSTPIAINIKGTREWGDWIENLAKHNRSTVAGAVDRALVLLAKESGFTEPPPERIP